MKVVYKYSFGLSRAVLDAYLPAEHKIVHVGISPEGVPAVWVELDKDDTTLQPQSFVIIATGQEIPNGHEHVGSFVNGYFVGHVYRDAVYADFYRVKS